MRTDNHEDSISPGKSAPTLTGTLSDHRESKKEKKKKRKKKKEKDGMGAPPILHLLYLRLFLRPNGAAWQRTSRVDSQ